MLPNLLAINKPKKSVHYVDNDELFRALVNYKKEINRAIREKKPRPMVTDYIGESIMKIATHLAFRPNFSSYTFRDEMVCDGIENCLQYIDNFDPKKSKNPFAYFTQIIYFAFVRRIQKEKRYQYTKYKMIERANLMEETVDRQDGDTESRGRHSQEVSQSEWTKEQMYTFMNEFESFKRKKRTKSRRNYKAPKGVKGPSK